MIALLLAAAVPLFQLPGGDAARFGACVALTKSEPERAVTEAEEWTQRSKDVPARHCLGLAYVATARWQPAAIAFEQAATGADTQHDGRAATLWSQAGNAALAADDPSRARSYLDHALALPTLSAVMRGEALIDRVRADVALQDLGAARTDLNSGLDLAAADPFAWLLSATLARRQGDLARASKDIEEAARLAPDDASVALEAGNIAAASGANDAARLAWSKAAQLAPDDPEGKAAAAALAANR